MRFALTKTGERTAPQPSNRAFCPGCHAAVAAKCGEVLTWHWAHLADASCTWDPEPETPWHRNWKAAAPDDRQEIALNGQRADIVSPSGLVIELQHSHLAGEHIRKREAAYQHMMWIFDARGAYAASRLTLRRHPDRDPDDLYRTIRWEAAPAYPSQAKASMLLDLDDETLIWIGAWHGEPGDRSKNGHGWLVTPEWVRRVIINGPHLPQRPSARRPLTAALLSQQEIRPATVAVTGPLDWSSHRIGPLRACMCCGRPALMRDANGKACHKVCAEREPPDATESTTSETADEQQKADA
jgi:hypothetical protein